MRDALIIFVLCIVAIIIGGWLFFYAPNGMAIFPHKTADLATYTPPVHSQAVAVEVAFSEITSGSVSQVTEQKNYAVRALDAFNDLWNKIGQTPPPPKVDFTKNDVIAVFAGQKPTGGYAIKVEKIMDMNGKRVVSIVLTQPGPNCMNTEALTSPYDVVKVPASALAPVKEERVETQDCN